jgi:hypothetical protein
MPPSTLQEAPLPAATGDVPRLELVEWAERYGVVAGITTRPADLGLASEDGAGQVLGRWRAFRAALAPRFPAVVLSHQVHGCEVRWHSPLRGADGWLVLEGVDGHATSAAGLLLTITVADCVPVYLAVPGRGAIALLHAGWRGTAARIVEMGVRLLARESGAAAADMVMHCGVGICGECYEVGPEVAAAFERDPAAPAPAGPRRLDLRAALVSQARALGVRHVTVSPWCTAHHPDRFFSHRASGGRDGRMVAYLGRARESP